MTEHRATTPLVEFDQVRAGYREAVVGPVSFQLFPGEILGLAGPNGAGKSTLLSALTGVARVFEGGIRRRDGLTISHHRQRPELPPEVPLTGRELLQLVAADHGQQPERLQAFIDRPLSRFSGGQFQFLQTCACLGSDAELILLDEPTNNLDGHAIEALSTLLAELSPQRSVLMVSHEKDFLEHHCTRIITLSLPNGMGVSA